MNKFIMLNGKRSGSNNLMNSLHHLTRTKMVWMDSPPDIWKTFGLSFSNDEILNLNISNCFDEIFQSNSGMKLNWDEPGYLDVIDIFLDYPVLKILTYRKNIFEKVISEMLAIQTGHWIGPVVVHKQYKRDYKFLATNRPEDITMESKMYGTTRTSYQNIGNARIAIRHSQPVNQELAAGRTQNVNALYIESKEGERFKYPYKHNNII